FFVGTIFTPATSALQLLICSSGLRPLTSGPPMHPQFLFAVCQCGAEAALKQELAASHPKLKFSFSRPGFVTFKFAEPCENPATYQLKSTFARTWGFSLGKVTGDAAQQLAAAAWQLPEVVAFLEEHPPADLHVWERDRVVPGEA